MRKTKVVLAKVLSAAMVISSFAGVQGITSEAAAKPKLSKKRVSITVGKTKKNTEKNAKKNKVKWKMKSKKIASFKKSGKYAVKVKAKKAGKTTLTATIKKGKKTKKLVCKITVKKNSPKVTKTPVNTPTTSPSNVPKTTAVPTATATAKPQDTTPAMKEIFKGVIDNVGTCLTYNQTWNNRKEMQDASTMEFVDKNFNSFTLENEMKPDNMLNKKTTISVADAKAKGYVISDDYKESTVPELTLETIDGVLAIAKQHNIRMRAHTLMWHQQTPPWFFKKNYDDEEAVVDEATMNARLEFFVRTVMRYTMQKEKELTGEVGSIVYAWDVLNEYIHRSNAAEAATWVSVYGDMGLKPTYVKAAFEYAYDELKRENVQDKVTLFYNDYDTYFSVDDELALISYINEGEKAKICGGIGMQSHVDIKRPTLEEYGNALKAFINAGLEVQITELDITINFDTDDTDGRTPSYGYKNEKETDADQAAFTKDFIKQIVDIQKNLQKNRDKNKSLKGITGITVWGISDQTSWRGSCRPLFFTRKNVGRVKDETTGKYKPVYTYVPKKSYEAMIEALK